MLRTKYILNKFTLERYRTFVLKYVLKINAGFVYAPMEIMEKLIENCIFYILFILILFISYIIAKIKLCFML